MEPEGKIEITVVDNNLRFSTNMSLIEANFWLDQTKAAILAGEVEQLDHSSEA